MKRTKTKTNEEYHRIRLHQRVLKRGPPGRIPRTRRLLLKRRVHQREPLSSSCSLSSLSTTPSLSSIALALRFLWDWRLTLLSDDLQVVEEVVSNEKSTEGVGSNIPDNPDLTLVFTDGCTTHALGLPRVVRLLVHCDRPVNICM